jgi:hypothetical protein
MPNTSKPSGKIVDSLYWWLSTSRPFFINDEYRLDLVMLDRKHNSAKIIITNLKTNEQEVLVNEQEG